jgi:3-keto-5-aminohexanoate cleavage enzyme
MARTPMLIAVAPNGARKSKLDHSELPLGTGELIKTAEKCLAAGAGMMHFHVRDRYGKHTLDHKIYGPVLKELEAAVGEDMLLQVSSESAGRYRQDEQIEQMKRLAPHCLSCGLRELVGDSTDYSAGQTFFSNLLRAGVLLQYILYSPADVEWYETLCADGVIPGDNHFLLFVLGRYQQGGTEKNDLQSYIAALKRRSPWMVCGFGQIEHDLAAQAEKLGGHARVGFENNLHLPDGSVAPDNAALVRLASGLAQAGERPLGDKLFAESLYGLS